MRVKAHPCCFLGFRVRVLGFRVFELAQAPTVATMREIQSTVLEKPTYSLPVGGLQSAIRLQYL